MNKSKLNFILHYGPDDVKHDAAKEYVNSVNQPLTYSERKIFADPKFPPEVHHHILDKFGGNIRPSLLDAIVEHPNTNSDVLHQIAHIAIKKSADDIVDKVAHHDNVKPETLRHISDNALTDHNISYVASNPKTPKDVLSKLIRHNDDSVRYEAMMNPNTHIDDINHYVTDDRNPIDNIWLAQDKIKKHLSESLDSKPPMDQVPEDSMLHQMGAMSAALVGGSDFKMHSLGENGYLIDFKRDGYREVHHVDKNLSGGHLSASMGHSMKLISTFKNHIQNILDSGDKVRILAHHNVASPFMRITKKVIDKHSGYTMSNPYEREHELTGDKMVGWDLEKQQ